MQNVDNTVLAIGFFFSVFLPAYKFTPSEAWAQVVALGVGGCKLKYSRSICLNMFSPTTISLPATRARAELPPHHTESPRVCCDLISLLNTRISLWCLKGDWLLWVIHRLFPRVLALYHQEEKCLADKWHCQAAWFHGQCYFVENLPLGFGVFWCVFVF